MRQRWFLTGPSAPPRLAVVLLLLVGAAEAPVALTVTGLSLPPTHAASGQECSEEEAAPAARGRAAVFTDLAVPVPTRPAFRLASGGRPPGPLTLLPDRCGPPPHHLRC